MMLVSIVRRFCALALILAIVPAQALAQWPATDIHRGANAAIDRGVKALLRMQNPGGGFHYPDPYGGGMHNYFQLGEAALAVYALSESGLARNHKAIRDALAFMQPLELKATYSVSMLILALDALRDPAHDERIRECARWLVQNVNQRDHLWGYPGNKGGRVDLSNTQLAVLALWTAERHGFESKRDLWIRVIAGLRAHQNADGGFSYHADGNRDRERLSTGTMTTAGITVLLLAQEMLADGNSGSARSKAQAALDRAWAWLDANFTGTGNPQGPGGLLVERYPSRTRFNYHHYYYLYGIERVATLGARSRIGGRPWYPECAAEILRAEEEQGGWASLDNTCLALLFLNRVTYTRMARAKQMPAAPIDEEWRFSLSEPVGDWTTAGFDDSAWKSGPGGFGKLGRDTSAIRTRWESQHLWLRRAFHWRGGDPQALQLHARWDDAVELYLNGVLAGRFDTPQKDVFVELELSAQARATLAPGQNLLALHASNRAGDQIIAVEFDAGEVPLDIEPVAAPTPWFDLQPSPDAPFIRRWLLLGPLADPDDSNLNRSLLPDESAAPTVKQRALRSSWRDVTSTRGLLPLAEFLRVKPDSSYYAFTYLDVSEETEALLWFGASGGLRAYLDGQIVASHHRHVGFEADALRAPVRLSAGQHRLLVKLDQRAEVPLLAVRLSDEHGLPNRNVIPHLTADTSDRMQAAAAHPALFELSSLLATLPALGKRARIDFNKATDMALVAASSTSMETPHWLTKATTNGDSPAPSPGAKGLLELRPASATHPARLVCRATIPAGKSTLVALVCGQVGRSSPGCRLGVYAGEMHWSERHSVAAGAKPGKRDWRSLTIDVRPYAGREVLLVIECSATDSASIFIDALVLR